MQPTEIITRRNLPHWYVPGAMHFVTYRLAGTIPVSVLHQFREERQVQLRQIREAACSLQEQRVRAHKQFFVKYDQYLDRTSPVDWLATPVVAAMIRGNLYHHNGSKYHLLAYCIMPNHVHVLLQPRDVLPVPGADAADRLEEPDEKPDAKSPLSSIMHSLKSYTAHRANELLERTGPFWQHESYDHWVRDEAELERIVYYIAWNPVKAGLVAHPYEWFFSSAHDRYLLDGSEEGFLTDLLETHATEPPCS
jgi:putative DNA methylase